MKFIRVRTFFFFFNFVIQRFVLGLKGIQSVVKTHVIIPPDF